MHDIFLAVLLAFAFSLLFCAAAIPLLKRAGSGQHILSYVKEHSKKEGTPTMGGLAFILAAVLAAIPFARNADRPFFVALAVGLGYLAVGFLDDLLKQKRGKNLGLRPYQKIIFQFGVALMASVYCCVDGLTVLRLPYTSFAVDIGWWMLPLGILVFLGTVNGVNLTDGLDGLAAGTGTVYFAVMGVICTMTAATTAADGDLALMSFVLAGALTAFLWFNSHPARMFMGDTGSLALGGAAATVAILSHNVLLIPLIGIMYVVSGISVIVQVASFKLTGKRVFAMAPFHHHLEYRGVKESKIVAQYTIVTAVAGAVALLAAAI